MICRGRPGNDDDDSSRTHEWNSRFRPIASLPHCPGAAAAKVSAAAAAGPLVQACLVDGTGNMFHWSLGTAGQVLYNKIETRTYKRKQSKTSRLRGCRSNWAPGSEGTSGSLSIWVKKAFWNMTLLLQHWENVPRIKFRANNPPLTCILCICICMLSSVQIDVECYPLLSELSNWQPLTCSSHLLCTSRCLSTWVNKLHSIADMIKNSKLDIYLNLKIFPISTLRRQPLLLKFPFVDFTLGKKYYDFCCSWWKMDLIIGLLIPQT